MNLRNNVNLIGRVSNTPKTNKINETSLYLTFNLAVEKFWKNKKTNEIEKKTQFFPILIFSQPKIKKAFDSLKVGTYISLSGEINYETYKDDSNNFKSFFSVYAKKWVVLKQSNSKELKENLANDVAQKNDDVQKIVKDKIWSTLNDDSDEFWTLED